MKNKFWIGSALAFALTVVTGMSLVYQQQTTSVVRTVSCDCAAGIVYDSTLPSSHPTNQCASAETTPPTSWYGWLVGSSRSTSFHFLDLLELIYRSNGESMQGNKEPVE